MFLLLMNFINFQLRDQFEIWQGITIAQAKEKNPKNHVPAAGYKLVNLSGIDPCSRLIDDKKLLEYYPERDIKTNKLLQKCDYLISCKGEVKGYSMLFSDNYFDELEKKKSFKGLVASNHFLVLRPRKLEEITRDELRFLHNILDIITPSLKKAASEKGGKAKYLNLNDVADFRFSFPYRSTEEVENFNNIYSKYSSRLNELNKAKRDLEKYNSTMKLNMLIDV